MKLQLRDLHLDGPITRPYDVEHDVELDVAADSLESATRDESWWRSQVRAE